MPNPPDTRPSYSSTRPQFGISAMLWSTLVAAMALGYLRQFNSLAVFSSCAIVVAAAIGVGVLIGWSTGRIGDATYWAVVIATAAFLSVARDVAAPVAFRHGWSAVGIASGAACGAVAPRQLMRRMICGTVGGGGAMAVCAAAMPVRDIEWLFDLICAPVVGGLVAVLIESILWLERQHEMPRYITASWLLCAVIGGNLLVPLVQA